ncbi:CaiB/BaiF CoA transferase family protein [Azospirillum agricola]|uniref:CaiB/BaiF CoA transferase family protein n=1 Tax=Azospirillum agricola TaxID=1720247 RepID=UPI000A0F0F31|nr:CoA transferase [Azospirillum agricola]SMH31396.1 Crotonobetainyl-CoA:carnitine CoA-transferase CaiB [Azospirillum lipoferum]
MRPLDGIRVLDFSTLLPGPLATLMLVEAGAEVIKIERPGRGDEMRSYEPKFGADAVNFGLLNRGKRSIALDLKAPGAVDQLMPLIRSADVIVEQYRPGVMDRLGLGYAALSAVNPGLIYCSITGYGQSGPKAAEAGHDLNYVAETGMLSLAAGSDGAPVLPAALVADVGGGTYPAVVNILMALLERNRTGKGCHLDIAMADGMFTFLYWAMGNGLAAGQWPVPGGDLVTGGTPRYQMYRTADGRFLAAAPLEDKFWASFCGLIGLPDEFRDDAKDPAATRQAVAGLIAGQDSGHWRAAFAGKDVCCVVMSRMEEALANPHFRERGLFARRLAGQDGRTITALPTPLAASLRADAAETGYPALGEANGDLLGSAPTSKE